MRGMGRMLIVAASVIAALSCEGCATATDLAPMDAGVSTPAPVSEGLKLAAPAPLGSPDMTAVKVAGIAPVGTELPRAQTIFTAMSPDGQQADQPAFSITLTTDQAEELLPEIDWSKSDTVQLIAARQTAEGILFAPVDVEQDFSAEFEIDAPKEITGLAFDLGVAPRIAYRQEGELKTRSFGGEVRIGQNFDQRGKATNSGSWYIFAGADGEALVWDTGENGFELSTSALALRDQVTVGDMQAGVSLQRGGGQLSLSYIRREVSYHERGLKGVTENEDFAGVSFTLRK